MSPYYYEIALSKIPHVGPVSARLLISYCGSAEAVFKEKKSKLLAIPGIGPSTVDQLRIETVQKEIEQEIQFLNKYNISALYYLDKAFPSRLKHFSDIPILLYYKGNGDLNQLRTVAIVGTRNVTEYGKMVTHRIITELKSAEVVIVSGLAYGVDTIAHRQCIQEEIPTIGVLGHGLDKMYPASNKSLADKMIFNGGLLTQFGINTKPDRENFPARNKIIAALADATIVIESRKKGGSIITAEFANEYNKDVFAVPGRINDEFSEGCNELIRLNKAMILHSAEDLMEVMQWKLDKKELFSKRRAELVFDLEPDENSVVNVLDRENKIHVDLLHKKLNFTPGLLAAILLNLEFKGVIKELPGKYYLLNN
ncbi:MAG: DNA-protecting protein DprA [Saprospiraceae bacterium]|nr:DNA-protecting protein DprA [Saprospiraceae bacterium]